MPPKPVMYASCNSIRSYPIPRFGTTPAQFLRDWMRWPGPPMKSYSEGAISCSVALGHVQRFVLTLVAVIALCGVARGQAAAEYSGATSISATTTADKAVIFPVGKPAGPKGPKHLVIPTGPPPEVVNRRALEENAGKDAGKLLLRSTPSSARVWIDGAFVGKTPTLLILAPGKYQVEVRGPRQESARQTVDLLPRENREVALRMAVPYPTNVSIH